MLLRHPPLAICREIKTGLKNGIDPIEKRKAAKLESQLVTAREVEQQRLEIERLAEEAAAQRSFSAAIEQWHKKELSRRKDGGEEAMRAIDKDVLPTLGDMVLIDIRRAMLLDIFDTVVDRGSRVNLRVMGEVIDRCLNHIEGNKLRRIYQRHELKAEQRDAWRLLGERLNLLLSNWLTIS